MSKKIFTNKTTRKVNKKKLALVVVVLILACVGGFFLYEFTGNAQPSMEELMQSGVFAQGVEIGGTPVGGLSYPQGKEKLGPETEQMIDDFTLTVKLDQNEHKMVGEDINLSTNLEPRMQEAIKIGNIGNRRERRKQQNEAKKNGASFELDYEHDKALLEQNLDTIYAQSGKAAKDATVKLEGGKPVYTEGQSGTAINKEKLAQDVGQVMERGEKNGVVTAEFVEQKPTYTVAMLQEKLVKKASTTTEFKSSGADRTANVVKAANMLNGTMVRPGETFSINKVLGARNEKNGWKIATGMAGGKYIDDVGGGVCQVSSTTYNAAMKAGLKVTGRTHHMFPVSYLPLGQDAAISTGGPDLEFVNNYDFPVYVLAGASASSKTIDVIIYGPRNADNSSINFKTEKISEDPPKSAAKVSENANLQEGEYVEVKPRKNRIEVKRWLEHVVDGKVIKTTDLSNDIYEAFTGEYVIGKGTAIDEKTGIPKGKKVDEKYLTTKRETTTTSTAAPTPDAAAPPASE